MQFSKLKLKLTAVSISILLTISTFVIIIGSVQAQTEFNGSVPLPSGVTPDVIVKTRAGLSFRPNPVGLDQIFLVNMWVSPALHRARYHQDYKITIEDPSGTQNVITMDSYYADATAWFEYIASQVGTWRLKFEFPGGYFPAGDYIDPRTGNPVNFPGSCYYEPSSTDWQTLEVQEEIVYSWPEAELPDDYWTRPVPFENREWAAILGDFPWRGPGGGSNWPAETNTLWDTRYNFLPYVEAPESAHVVWKRLYAISGLIGAGQGYDALTRGSGGPSIIYQGKCYQTLTLPGGESGLQCYDLRTGEMYWEISPSPLPSGASFVGIEYTGLATPAVPGAVYQASASTSLIALATGTLAKVDPWTGQVTEVSITSGRHSYYRNGYVLTVQDLGSSATPTRYRLLNWTTIGSSSNFESRVVSNITWQFNRGPAPGMGFDFEAGYAAATSPITPPEVGAITAWGVNVVSLTTGDTIWEDTVDVPPFDAMQAYCADHGKIAIVMMDGTVKAFDLRTGNLAWVSDTMDYPWDSTGFGSYGMASAYGMLWRFAYSGIYAFDWDTGKIVWKYEAPAFAEYETPYIGENQTTVYPFDGIGWVADGKVYTANTEHTPTAPITRGWGVHCIDAFTGELVWKLMITSGGVGGGISGTPGGIAGIADGYMVVSGLDGYMYVIGKGKSATTVTAPDVAVPKGTAMTIKGTVLDQSPAQLGTPCVSKSSMSTQMEYLHIQQPIDGIWHNETIIGVPVSLTAISDYGSYVDIGTVTTDGYSGTFGVAWTPTEEGTYKILASFEGDESYGSSSATTWVTVGPAPTSGGDIEPEPEPEPEPTPLISTELAIAIAVIAAIVIGIVAFVLLRRRK